MKKSSSLYKFNVKNIDKTRLISRGKYGIVYHVIMNNCGNVFECAMKEFFNLTTDNDIKKFENEVKIMNLCDNENIVGIFDSVIDKIPIVDINFNTNMLSTKPNINFPQQQQQQQKKKRKQYIFISKGKIFLELCKDMTLDEVLKKKSNYSNKERLDLLIQIAKGMLYLHEEKKIIHYDLKPRNILFGFDGKIKICDFGSATRKNAIIMTNQMLKGTIGYICPELICEENMSSNFNTIDIYSFGILMWVMWAECDPYQQTIKNDQYSLLREISEENLRPNMDKIKELIPPFISNLITSCWNEDPKKRPQSFSDILKILTKSLNSIDRSKFKFTRSCSLCCNLKAEETLNSFLPKQIFKGQTYVSL